MEKKSGKNKKKVYAPDVELNGVNGRAIMDKDIQKMGCTIAARNVLKA